MGKLTRSCRLLVIVGPTGAGKSELALRVAEALDGEIVSADSQQVYRGMDIGTGKVSAAARNRVPHHLIDVVEPDDEMTAVRFAELADSAIADAGTRKRPVLVAGGTGLYIRSLLLGFFAGPAADPTLRAKLELHETSELWRRLGQCDPEMVAKIDANDRKRIIRALEVFELSGMPMSQHQRQHDHRCVEPRYPHRILCISPEREELYERIDARVDEMMEQGLLEEVRGLREKGFLGHLRSQQAIGYAELHAYLEGKWDLPEAVRLIKRNSRRYARRQLSWYRNGPTRAAVEWYPGSNAVDLPSVKRYLLAPEISAPSLG